MERKYYPTLDLWKYICSILVLVIHTNPFSFNFWLDGAAGLVTRFANPSFFAISGFLLFCKIGKTEQTGQNKVVWGQIKRICILYLIWSVLFFVILLHQNIEEGNIFDPIYYLRAFLLKGVVRYFWFFPALALAILIVYALHKLGLSSKAIALIGAVLLLIGCAFSTYSTVFLGKNVVFDSIYNHFFVYITAKNGLFFGFPYVAMGKYLADNEKRLSGKGTPARHIAFAAAFFVLLGGESLIAMKYVKPDDDSTYLWIFVYPLIYATLRFLLSTKMFNNSDFRLFGKLSSFTYVFQFIPITLVSLAFTGLHFEAWYSGIIMFICVVVLCNAVGYAVIMASKKVKVLKYLF